MRTQRHTPISAREIGRIDRPLRSCIEWLAVRCSLECCGMDACSVTPVMLEIWSGSVGKDKTRSAITQALEIVRLCDESDEVLDCDLVDFRVLCLAMPGAAQTQRGEFARVWKGKRRRLREFFASLAEGLKPCA
jgi:hypothetical protein